MLESKGYQQSEREPMQFKVGDRVEVLKPAAGVRTPDLNYVGPGTIEDVDEASAKVRVDANEKAWWYALGDIRHAVEEIEIHPTPSITQAEADRMRGDKIREELYGVKYATPTIEADKLKAGTMQRPITVGTQVRLTGVVRQVQPNGAIGVDVYVGCQDGLHWFRPSEVEVIRQPFKRGEEVAYDHVLDNADDDEWALVVRDEGPDGMFWMVYKHLEAKVHQRHFSEFKRRPERRP